MPTTTHQTVLIHTLGNRDLQFARSAGLPADFAREYLEKNSEPGGENYLVLRKGRKGLEDLNFRDISSRILGAFQAEEGEADWLSGLHFPMLEAVIDFVAAKTGQIDCLLLCATHQLPAHPQDTDLVAEIAALHFAQDERLRQIRTAYLDVSPTAAGRNRMLRLGFEMLEKLKAEGFQDFFISNRQGLPDLSLVLDLLGFFQGYHYLASHALHGVSVVDFADVERIMAELVRRRLANVLPQAPLSTPLR